MKKTLLSSTNLQDYWYTHLTPSIKKIFDRLVKKLFSGIEQVGYKDRPGIVHRLDKDTSGLMIISTHCSNTYAYFSDLLKTRNTKNLPFCLVIGHPKQQGSITYPPARHPKFLIK